MMDNYKFTNLTHLKKGPIGLQKYGEIPVEYKDIRIEVDPTDTNLVTFKPELVN